MSQNAKSSISHKIAELDQAVEWFYGDEFTLDEAVAKYQSAAKLSQAIEHDLSELKNQVEVLADFTK